MAKGRVGKGGMRVGKLRWREMVWKQSLTELRAPTLCCCLPSSRSVPEALQGQQGCWLSRRGAARLPLFDLLMLELFPSHTTHLPFSAKDSTFFFFFTGFQFMRQDLQKPDDNCLPLTWSFQSSQMLDYAKTNYVESQERLGWRGWPRQV